ncbi:uncharacterized protein YALI1_D33111g [Yarrowia lipolytica]|uniref:Uncharacterized protein n=1 Tax=Yarrowia lipolytica TaxID=4952 RepID=A0A1D8NG69_YARLL|nr:hypothetical protein YALI1_D33111g [Yarrowia lipolytica]
MSRVVWISYSNNRIKTTLNICLPPKITLLPLHHCSPPLVVHKHNTPRWTQSCSVSNSACERSEHGSRSGVVTRGKPRTGCALPVTCAVLVTTSTRLSHKYTF